VQHLHCHYLVASLVPGQVDRGEAAGADLVADLVSLLEKDPNQGTEVTTVAALAQELRLAHKELRLPKLLKSYARLDLVITDELGYVNLSEEGPLLFQFFAERYERGSVLITSNLEFSRWSEVFGETTMTAALLDRLTHHLQLLVLQGESYRLRQSQARQRGERG
jgi:DNA replication protein DnaC